MNGFFSSSTEKNQRNNEKKILLSILSDQFSLRKAKLELVKIQSQDFHPGLEVHLEDMF